MITMGLANCSSSLAETVQNVGVLTRRAGMDGRPTFWTVSLPTRWTAISQAIRSGTPVTPQALNAIDVTLMIDDLTRLAARSPRSIAACNTAAARMTDLKRARLAAETPRDVARDT